MTSSAFASRDRVTSDGVSKIRARFTPSGALRARLQKGQPRVRLVMEGEDPGAAQAGAGEQA